MITIVKGNSKLTVTKGTFEDQYKSLGYRIASNKEGATRQVAPIVDKEEVNQEKTLTDFKESNKIEEDKINEKFGLKSKKGK